MPLSSGIHARSAMPESVLQGPLPPMRLLRTFESAARLGGFSAAAEELYTTQPAVSRTIADLERRLGTRLFDRLHRGVRLTGSGELYRDAVVNGLARIGAMGTALAGRASAEPSVVIACGHATSSMFLMPRFPALRRALGADAGIRVLTCDNDLLVRLGASDADVVLSYDAADSAPEDRAVAFREAVTPVCSPAYAEAHRRVLGRPVTGWSTLTFLYLARPSHGWMTWEDWFDAVGRPRRAPRYEAHQDYVYLVDAACAGQGLALGWRHFLDRHFDAGLLVPIPGGFLESGRPHFARLTRRGRRNPVARRCLDFFDALSRSASEP